MKPETRQRIAASIENFRLPRYNEIPNVGLYLVQAGKYINEYLLPLGDYALTPSMISNYVKKGLISSPVRKQYNRDQIAYLLFIAIAKNVLSLDALMEIFRLQRDTYTLPEAYDRFCDQFEMLLRFTFELSDTLETGDSDESDARRLLYTCIVAAVQKVYLEKYLQTMAKEDVGR